MFLINKQENRIESLGEITFSELGFKERENLQEWIADNPEFFGEELLIIQKEFDGFDDTKERLDLLALDKQGNIVVIENKLDDSGRDVTWQVLKYASYCATLSKNQIKDIYQQFINQSGSSENAETLLKEFFEVEDLTEVEINQAQRLIMVAGKFRKEVTSTVLWLLNNYKLQIQCFKITPYKINANLLLNVEQVIPVKEAEEYMISIAKKNQEENQEQSHRNNTFKLRKAFWKDLLDRINQTNITRFQNVNPSKDPWITGGVGMSGVSLNFVFSKNYARTEVMIARPVKEENKYIFDTLYKQKDKLEESYGEPLEWERLDDKKSSRIKHQLQGVNGYDSADWPQLMGFMINSMQRLDKVFVQPLEKINNTLKSKGVPGNYLGEE